MALASIETACAILRAWIPTAEHRNANDLPPELRRRPSALRSSGRPRLKPIIVEIWTARQAAGGRAASRQCYIKAYAATDSCLRPRAILS